VDVAVLGVPTFATSPVRSGGHATPRAVRLALARLSTRAPSRGLDVAALAPLDLGDVDDPDLDVDGEWRTIQAVGRACAMASVAVLVGGDGALTAPAVVGAAGDALGTAGLVVLSPAPGLDAGRSPASAVRRVLESGLDPRRAVVAGVADWAGGAEHDPDAASLGLRVVPRSEVDDRGVEDCVRFALDTAGAAGGPVHVALDLAVCDSAAVPACPDSLPGGLSARELLAAAALAGADPRVASVGLSGVDASLDPDGRTVRLAALCLLEVVAGLAARTSR